MMRQDPWASLNKALSGLDTAESVTQSWCYSGRAACRRRGVPEAGVTPYCLCALYFARGFRSKGDMRPRNLRL